MVPTDFRKEPVRVDWRCYAREIGRVGGLLTETEVNWLRQFLDEEYKISIETEEFKLPDHLEEARSLVEESENFEDLELLPVKLNAYSEHNFVRQIFGYIINFPMENVHTVDDLLKMLE